MENHWKSNRKINCTWSFSISKSWPEGISPIINPVLHHDAFCILFGVQSVRPSFRRRTFRKGLGNHKRLAERLALQWRLAASQDLGEAKHWSYRGLPCCIVADWWIRTVWRQTQLLARSYGWFGSDWCWSLVSSKNFRNLILGHQKKALSPSSSSIIKEKNALVGGFNHYEKY